MPVSSMSQTLTLNIDPTAVDEIKYTPILGLRGASLSVSEVTRDITKV